MIPRNGPKSELLPPLNLYKEDLEQLVSLFKEKCQAITIGDEQHCYESLNEMEERLPGRLKSFVVSGVVPHAEIVLRGSYSVPLGVQRSTLWIVERNEKSELLFLSVKELLSGRRWRWPIVLRKVILVVAVLGLIACLFAKPFVGPRHVVSDIEQNLASIFAFGLLVLGVLMHNKQVSFITLAARSKSESFWQRNRDKVVLAIVSLLLGAVGTLAVEWLKRFFFPR